VSHLDSVKPASSLALITPALIGAASFACADVLGKVTLNAGAGVLTIVTFRGFVGLALLYAWLRLAAAPAALSPRARLLALGLGVLFTGNVFFLFKSLEAVAVPIAILTYFVYPLLTGLAAAACGLERVSLRGGAAAIAAFLGLALMIGAHPVALPVFGIAAALAAACCRVTMLLLTRARLQGADPRLITWYSLVSSTALLTGVSLATLTWQPPESALGWSALIVVSVAVTAGILGVYASTGRIGPFRTALFMNIEPLLATIGSALLLGEVITPLQALGGAVMIAALVAFQARR
jgi:drug/metabolite transporter (DMT)-like permease